MKIPVIRNTLTNYVKIFTFLAEGILVARWIIGFLGLSSYGLWALLWSFFVYSVLLDFGCGIAAQKYTSGGLYEKDPAAFSRIQSTIFTFHAAMSLLIVGATFACSFILPWLLNISDPEKLAEAKTCFYLFGFGSAILFPTGIFPEILIGLQKLYLRNLIVVSCKLLELAGAFILFSCGCGLISLIAFVMFMTFFANMSICVCILHLLPKFHLRLGWDKTEWKNILKFSGFIYIGMLSKLIIHRSSRLLISIFCGLTSVGVFQLSCKVADLCGQAVSQYQENISPITGALFKRGKLLGLGKIIFGAMRWNAFAATGVMTASFLLAEPLLKALFKISDPEITRISRWLILSAYISSVFRSVPHLYLQMSEQHKLATGILCGEAAANLILNLILLKPLGVIAVVWVSLSVKFLIAAGLVVPLMLRQMHVSAGSFLHRIFLQPFLAALPVILWILAFQHFFPGQNAWMTLLICGGVAAVLYAVMMFLLCPLPSKIRRHIPLLRPQKAQ